MSKKTIIGFAIFLVLFFTSNLAFAANNVVNDVGNSINNIVSNTKNMISDTGSNISSAANNVTNKTGMNNMANNMSTDINKEENIMSNDMMTDGTNYTAARTATTASGINNSTLMWIILAISAIAIVGLVWYYGKQFEHSDME